MLGQVSGAIERSLHAVDRLKPIYYIDRKFTPDDIEDELKKGLEQGGTESNDDTAETTGCEIVLNGTKKLFGGSTIFVARVLENDLPDNVKEFEASDRSKARAKKKAEAKKKGEEEEAEE